MKSTVLEFLRRHARAKRTEDALYSWQQTCDEQERELAELRGRAWAVVNSFDRKPTEGCVEDVVELAEMLRAKNGQLREWIRQLEDEAFAKEIHEPLL